jgi:hypothetical protein
MNSSNEVLKKDFDEMHSSHAAVVKEKEEKMECEMWGRDVTIFRSSRNWLCPVMLHSLKIFLRTLVG